MLYLYAAIHCIGLMFGIRFTLLILSRTFAEPIILLSHALSDGSYNFSIHGKCFYYAAIGWTMFALPFFLKG